jgi:hypothetical protein
MNTTTIQYRRRVFLTVTIFFTSTICPAQTQIPGVISPSVGANSHRPLPDALDQLQKMISRPINFEEAPYQSSKDLAAREVQSNSGPINFAFPVGGRFTASLTPGDTDPLSTTQAVLNAYSSAGLSGIYQVATTGNRVDVMPSKTLASDGVSWLTVAPVMAQPVSFPVASRSVAETI